MLIEHKKNLLKEKKRDELKELIHEEIELKESVKGIIYWLYVNNIQDMSKGHIIANAKKALHLLNSIDDEIKNIEGPTKLTTFTINTINKEPKHLSTVLDEKVSKEMKLIINKVKEKEFIFSEQQIEDIQAHCINVLSKLDFNTDELEPLFELIGR
jgi:hypothetical protein